MTAGETAIGQRWMVCGNVPVKLELNNGPGTTISKDPSWTTLSTPRKLQLGGGYDIPRPVASGRRL